MMKAKAIVASLFAISACTVAVAGESISYKVDGAEFEGYFAKASGPAK